VNDRNRTTRLPDNNRFWTSVGATYQWSDRLAINASYSRVMVRKGDINLINGHPAFGGPPSFAAFVGSARSHVDIVSLGITSRWGSAAPAVVAKY
ncbi:MAG: transporter, partial [Alphaproteobacteria bacterium]|nr:transporter [Alphaproteobacteria bacterium]